MKIKMVADVNGADVNGIHLFSALGRLYAFDLYRLETYELSETAYNILERALLNPSGYLPGNGFPADLKSHEISDWLALVNVKLIRREPPSQIPEPRLPPVSSVVNSIVINVAEECNFNCTYCFGHQGLYQRTKGKLMTAEVGRACIDWVMERSGDQPMINVCFFGGEPLLNLPLIKEIVTYANQKGKERGKTVTYNTTTNTSLLDEKTLKILDDLNVRFQVSLDGIGKEHDVHRRFKNGRGSWQAIEKNLKHIMQNGREVTVRTTVAHGNVRVKKIVNDILDYGFKRLFVCPATGIDGAAITKDDVDVLIKEFGSLAEQYLESARQGNVMSGFMNLHREVKRLMDPRFVFSGCAAGKNYFTIGVEGDIYVCMHVVYPNSPYRIGNVVTGEFDKDMHRLYQTITVDDKADCSKCWARYLCGNCCFARNLNMGQGFDRSDPDFCAIERRTYDLALAIVARLKEEGLTPFTEEDLKEFRRMGATC